MDRLKKIRDFVADEFKRNIIIEPENREGEVLPYLMEAVSTYNPDVIVKLGIGNWNIIKALLEETPATIVIVDPSMEAINVCREDLDRKELEKIRFICGDYHRLPVDFYRADMAVALDIFEFCESAVVIDELRRVLQFDGVLVAGTPVLHEKDVEGALDEYLRRVFNLHNDLYLSGDMNTVLTLNEFVRAAGNTVVFREDFSAKTKIIMQYGDNEEDVSFHEDEKGVFEDLYGLHEKEMDVPYYMGTYIRKKQSGQI